MGFSENRAYIYIQSFVVHNEPEKLQFEWWNLMKDQVGEQPIFRDTQMLSGYALVHTKIASANKYLGTDLNH